MMPAMKAEPKLSQLSHAGKDALILSLMEKVNLLETEIKELKAKSGLNSRNSSKPPSSDGYGKPEPKSQRKKSGRSSGGQAGHPGGTLKRVSNPDEKVIHTLEVCPDCQTAFPPSAHIGHQSRQVFDLPEVKVRITEHQAVRYVCPCCQAKVQADFPLNVTQPVQYGQGIKSWITYLSQYQLLPFKRLQELFQDLYGLSLSQGTLHNVLDKGWQQLSLFEETVQTALGEEDVVHFDESGVRVKKVLHWLHVAATEKLTYYRIHSKRGQAAMDAMGILPEFDGVAVHDHWASYYGYDCYHALCNAHHLRELTFAVDAYEQDWAEKLLRCLVEAKEEVEAARVKGKTALDASRLRYYEQRYSRILRDGRGELPQLKPPDKPQRGRTAQHKIKNLHDRLWHHKYEVLAYLYDFAIPFDNNLAERDIRMVKTQQKISGCFRSTAGADRFALIRSYLSTVRKNGINVMEALILVFEGKAWLPSVACGRAE